MPDAQLRSLEEVASLTRLSRSTLYTLMSAGKLGFIKVGRRRLIPTQALAQLIEDATVVVGTEGQEVQPCDR